ncbi:uncharacterized protein [Dermacentor andersoni]|uniref:uncharacterized protein isoform X2 n=1 Tax=Dermacentor andersoni TaxID=34620 RepID=UPI002155D151|nr:uncharacterized protein LOC126533249 isoform X2 [Dermacentor andersoni]
MRLLLVFAVIVLIAIVCATLSDAKKREKVEKQSQFRRYMRFARQLALRYQRSAKHAMRVTKVTNVELNGDRATIYFNAVDTVCKPGRRIPTRQRCPKIRGREPHTCFGEVKFLGDSFRRVKYGKTNCLRIDASLEIPATSASR